MKIRYIFALFIILGIGAIASRAQETSPSSPFVLAVTNISSGYVHVWTNSTVSFSFTASAAVKVDELEAELNKSGIDNKRRVRIMDGDQIIAEGWLVGSVNGSLADGFMLRLNSPELASEAAGIIRERGSLRYPRSFHVISSGGPDAPH